MSAIDDSEIDPSINYRQYGKLPKGKIHRGVLPRRFTTVASIPSKFETILFAKPKETKGFSQGAPRFEKRVEKEGPGPGQYYGAGPDRLLRGKPESWSRKGWGPFASRARRIPPKKHNYFPGPGTYSEHPARKRNPQLTRSHKHIFESRSPKIAYNAEWDLINPSLGPGHYDTPVHALSSNRPRRVYVYKSPTGGGKLGGDARAREMKIPRPVFWRGGKRFIEKKPDTVSEPGAYYEPTFKPSNQRSAAGAFRSTSKKIDFIPKPLPNPAPGAYHRDDGAWNSDMRPSGVFIKRGTDKFGRVLEPKSRRPNPADFPAPGHYDPDPKPRRAPTPARIWVAPLHSKGAPKVRMPARSGSSAFVSRSPKGLEFGTEDKPVGPAYYQGVGIPPRRISFHNNVKRKWVG